MNTHRRPRVLAPIGPCTCRTAACSEEGGNDDGKSDSRDVVCVQLTSFWTSIRVELITWPVILVAPLALSGSARRAPRGRMTWSDRREFHRERGCRRRLVRCYDRTEGARSRTSPAACQRRTGRALLHGSCRARAVVGVIDRSWRGCTPGCSTSPNRPCTPAMMALRTISSARSIYSWCRRRSRDEPGCSVVRITTSCSRPSAACGTWRLADAHPLPGARHRGLSRLATRESLAVAAVSPPGCAWSPASRAPRSA